MAQERVNIIRVLPAGGAPLPEYAEYELVVNGVETGWVASPARPVSLIEKVDFIAEHDRALYGQAQFNLAHGINAWRCPCRMLAGNNEAPCRLTTGHIFLMVAALKELPQKLPSHRLRDFPPPHPAEVLGPGNLPEGFLRATFAEFELRPLNADDPPALVGFG